MSMEAPKTIKAVQLTGIQAAAEHDLHVMQRMLFLLVIL